MCMCVCVYVDWTAAERCAMNHITWKGGQYEQSVRWKTAGPAKVRRNVTVARITTVQNNLQPERMGLYSHAADL